MSQEMYRGWRECLLVVLAILAPTTGLAQGTRGASITGIVRDTTGAVMPGVQITVINQATGSRITVSTVANGSYLAAQLLPGTYTIAAQQRGFKALSISGLRVDVGSTLTQDLSLDVGTITETVRVTGRTSLVETMSGEVGSTVTMSQVLEMPLLDRNVLSLINLTPGAYYVQAAPAPRTYINGSMGRDTTSTVDGALASGGALSNQGTVMQPPVDAVEEFKVLTSNYSAEFGRSSTATVTVATKSGSNEFHGTLLEFLRNDKLDAAGWGVDRKAKLRRNQFGGNVGGPIIRNKAFFFFNYEGIRVPAGSTQTRNVGRPEWRAGDFATATRQVGNSAVVAPIYDPETGTGTVFAPRGNLPFPNNVIPSNRLDPVAVKALAFLPNPNRAPDNPYNQAGNWQANLSGKGTVDTYIVRGDYNWSDATKMFYRAMFRKPEKNITEAHPDWGVADPSATYRPAYRQNHSLNLTRLFSSTFFGSFTMGYSRDWLPQVRSGYDGETNYAEMLGLPNTPGDGFPFFAFPSSLIPMTNLGTGLATHGGPGYTTEWMANFTRVTSSHTFKFGGRHFRSGGNLQRLSTPTFNFDGRYTQGRTATGAAVAGTGLSMADMLLGRMNSVSYSANPMRGMRINGYAAYFQDDWRVTSNLTLNLGVHYGIETPPYEVAGRTFGFLPYAPNPLAGTGDIPAGATGIMIFPNRNGIGKYMTKWNRRNIDPRVGFAYRLFGSSDTTIRGGYGIYHMSAATDGSITEVGQGAFGISYSAEHPVAFRLRDGLPLGAVDTVPESELTPTYGMRGTRFAQAGVTFLNPARVTPYVQSFNLTIQHQWKGILFEVGFVGSIGNHILVGGGNMNYIPLALLSHTETPVRLRRPFSVFASDNANVGMDNYNDARNFYRGFTFKSERRFSNGIGWLVAYTQPKTLIYPYEGAQTYENRRLERCEPQEGVREGLVFSPIVDLPFGKGRKWMNRGGILNAVLGGWQVSSIGMLQKGFPFGLGVLNGGRDILGDQMVPLRPDLIGEPNSASQGEPAIGVRGIQWLNPAAFAVPAKYTLGNSARSLPGVRSPGLVNFDMSISKNFNFLERFRLQYRWETFNTFNSPAFGRPNTSLGGNNFGIVTSAGGKRLTQMGLKLYW